MKNIVILLLAFTLLHCKSAQQNVSTATLENTYWKLAEMNGNLVVTPADAKEVHIILTSVDSEKRLKGFGGCNAIGGNFRTKGNQINFTVISTKMFCESTMEVEYYVTNALSKAQTYSIDGETLSFYNGTEKLITLQAVYFK